MKSGRNKSFNYQQSRQWAREQVTHVRRIWSALVLIKKIKETLQKFSLSPNNRLDCHRKVTSMALLILHDLKDISSWPTGSCGEHTWYLSFLLHEQNFWRIKFTPKKSVNYDKIHSKLPIFCVLTAKYTENCQFFVLNL